MRILVIESRSRLSLPIFISAAFNWNPLPTSFGLTNIHPFPLIHFIHSIFFLYITHKNESFLIVNPVFLVFNVLLFLSFILVKLFIRIEKKVNLAPNNCISSKRNYVNATDSFALSRSCWSLNQIDTYIARISILDNDHVSNHWGKWQICDFWWSKALALCVDWQ